MAEKIDLLNEMIDVSRQFFVDLYIIKWSIKKLNEFDVSASFRGIELYDEVLSKVLERLRKLYLRYNENEIKERYSIFDKFQNEYKVAEDTEKETLEIVTRLELNAERHKLEEYITLKTAQFDRAEAKRALKLRKFGINKNISLYRLDGTALQGGTYANDIWPTISMRWIKNIDNLGIKSDDGTIKFRFCKNNIGSQKEPLFNKGTYSAVYEIDDFKGNIYILKLFKRSTPHILNNDKVFNELQKFEKYFMDIYSYGSIRLGAKEFISTTDTYAPISFVNKVYTFDYYITKKYNISNALNGYGSLLPNNEKYNLLINSLIFLEDLQRNNYFHSDFKIGNIGWTNNMV
jgi:hypothetical protein